jgi:hypothetical protein
VDYGEGVTRRGYSKLRGGTNPERLRTDGNGLRREAEGQAERKKRSGDYQPEGGGESQLIRAWWSLTSKYKENDPSRPSLGPAFRGRAKDATGYPHQPAGG